MLVFINRVVVRTLLPAAPLGKLLLTGLRLVLVFKSAASRITTSMSFKIISSWSVWMTNSFKRRRR